MDSAIQPKLTDGARAATRSIARTMQADDSAGCRLVHLGGVTLVLTEVPQTELTRSAVAVDNQRAAGRNALRRCSELHGAPRDGWDQRPDGAPLPNEGWYWSISHKRRWAGAVISRIPVGLDIEAVVPRKTPLYDEVGDQHEWVLVGGRNWPGFYRVWTAKEATLKANGVGIGKLADCRLVRTIDSDHSITTFRGHEWYVEHLAFDDHLAAVATPAFDATDTSRPH